MVTPPVFGLVVLVVVTQAFSVACVTYICQTLQQLAIGETTGGNEGATLAKDLESPAANASGRSFAKNSDNPTSEPTEPALSLSCTQLRTATKVSDSHPNARPNTRVQNLHMPTTILPPSGLHLKLAMPAIVDENMPKPSFNISTPEGRYQMKQYVREQIERNRLGKAQPARNS